VPGPLAYPPACASPNLPTVRRAFVIDAVDDSVPRLAGARRARRLVRGSGEGIGAGSHLPLCGRETEGLTQLELAAKAKWRRETARTGAGGSDRSSHGTEVARTSGLRASSVGPIWC